MEVRFSCSACRAPAAVAVSGSGAAHRCAACGAERTLRFSASLREQGVADRCAVCGNEHFYVQKDFDQRIGCAVIAVGAALTPWTYGLSLAVCALIDLILHRRLPDVAKCYVCKATYRGGARNPAHEPFDLHRLERYEAEARRAASEAVPGEGAR
jgi:predicted RNA-binding Zn-ribbon protein involved in translation (DUF1610 family)